MMYAYFDAGMPEPRPVMGWYNTEDFDYVLPPAESLVEMTAAQWAVRGGTPFIVDGKLSARPAYTRAELLAVALADLERERAARMNVAVECVVEGRADALRMHAGAAGQAQLSAAFMAKQMGAADLLVVDASGVPAQLTAAQADQVFRRMSGYAAACNARYATLYAGVVFNPEMTLTDGWPAVAV